MHDLSDRSIRIQCISAITTCDATVDTTLFGQAAMTLPHILPHRVLYICRVLLRNSASCCWSMAILIRFVDLMLSEQKQHTLRVITRTDQMAHIRNRLYIFHSEKKKKRKDPIEKVSCRITRPPTVVHRSDTWIGSHKNPCSPLYNVKNPTRQRITRILPSDGHILQYLLHFLLPPSSSRSIQVRGKKSFPGRDRQGGCCCG